MNSVKENQSWTVFKAVKTDFNQKPPREGKGETVLYWAQLRIQQGKMGIYSQGAGCRGQGMEKAERIARE